jgi:hypothetical protein
MPRLDSGKKNPMSEQQPEATSDDERDDSADSRGDVESGEQGEITDDQLPPDVRPEEDNPLARHPDQTGDQDDEIGADTEGEADTAPLTQDDAEYGHPGDPGDSGSGSDSD